MFSKAEAAREAMDALAKAALILASCKLSRDESVRYSVVKVEG